MLALLTAVDHIGETAIGFAAVPGSLEDTWGTLPFPHHLNFAGDLDIAGGVKPQSLYRQVLWGVRLLALSVQRPGSHAYWKAWGWDDEVPSWSWPVRKRTVSLGCTTQEIALKLFNLPRR